VIAPNLLLWEENICRHMLCVGGDKIIQSFSAWKFQAIEYRSSQVGIYECFIHSKYRSTTHLISRVNEQIEVHGFCVLELPFQVDNSSCSFIDSQVKLRARNQTMFGFAFEISQIMVSTHVCLLRSYMPLFSLWSEVVLQS
jgi:hypothetical protein